jgi:hypothetical protein
MIKISNIGLMYALLVIDIFMVSTVVSFFIYHIYVTDNAIKQLTSSDDYISKHLVGTKILHQQADITNRLNKLLIMMEGK